MRGSCANAPLYAALIRSVARAWGRCSTEPIVKEKGPMNLSCLRMYHILQSTHFRIVARGAFPYISYLGMQGYGFLRHFSQKYGIHFGHFGLKLGIVFAFILN